MDLGNWFGYGEDGVGPWVQAMKYYTENVPLLALTFVLPLLAMLAAVCVRWIHRAYFVALIFVGTAISVGVYPYDDPSPLGGLFKAFQEGSTSGLALRSTPRAVPLLVLGFAVLLAAAVDALRRRAGAPAVLDRCRSRQLPDPCRSPPVPNGGCPAGSPPPPTYWSSSSRSPMRHRCSAACSSTRT